MSSRLHWWASLRRRDVVRQRLAAGANVNGRGPSCTPTIRPVEHGRPLCLGSTQMDEPKDRTPPRHPNDPDVVAHQMRMAAVTMTHEERDALLASIDRQLREIDGGQRTA